MLNQLKIVCLIFVGIDAVLFAVWGHLTGSMPTLVVAIGTFVGYLGLLSLAYKGDDKAFLVKGAKCILEFLLKTAQRAACSGLTALVVCVFLICSIVTATVDVVIVVKPDEDPLVPELKTKPFQIEVRRLDSGSKTYERKEDAELHISFPLCERDRSITVTVTHDGYKPRSRVSKIEELSSGPVILKPEPRAALIVTVHRQRSVPATPKLFRVKAWAAGQRDTPTERELTSVGEAVFVAAQQQDWYVQVYNQDRRLVHNSTHIPVDKQRKSYDVDLADTLTFRWYKVEGADPPELTWKTLSTHAFATSVGESLVRPDIGQFFFGGAPSGGKVLLRKWYVVSYNPVLKVPNWVAYRLDNLPDRPSIRRPHFVTDPDLNPSVAATSRDYRVSNRRYDRGHLVSGGDMRRLGEQAMREAYYHSALAPQTPVLNRYTWYAIEAMARTYVAKSGESIYITAGPAFLDTSSAGRLDERSVRTTIGNGVAVPTHFFRVHVRLVRDRPDVLAFLVPNDSDLDRDPTEYIVSLATVENATGLRFFTELLYDQQPDREHIPNALWVTQ